MFKLELFSILKQKEFFKCINSKESNGSLKSFKSIKFNHIFIHSVMSENDKNVHLIILDFHTK